MWQIKRNNSSNLLKLKQCMRGIVSPRGGSHSGPPWHGPWSPDHLIIEIQKTSTDLLCRFCIQLVLHQRYELKLLQSWKIAENIRAKRATTRENPFQYFKFNFDEGTLNVPAEIWHYFRYLKTRQVWNIWIFAQKMTWIIMLNNPCSTVFENHRKSLIQHCERSELRLHFESTKVH